MTVISFALSTFTVFFILVVIPYYLPIFYRELRNSWISEPVECEVLEFKMLPGFLVKKVFIKHQASIDGEIKESTLTGGTIGPFFIIQQEVDLYQKKFEINSKHPGYWDRNKSELYIEFRKYHSFDKVMSVFFFLSSIVLWVFMIVYGIFHLPYLFDLVMSDNLY